jgi:two-component system alkaline phosphatase synthesis response regulator PhoP
MAGRLLLVEDEPGLVITLSDRLRREGYTVEVASDGDTGLARAGGEAFDLILLDVLLPGRDGFSVCRELRRRGVTTPVLMLTARSQVDDKVAGLKLGADDYLTKPFDMAELLARIEARVRRRPQPATADLQETFRFGGVEVDFRRAEVTREGQPVELSAKEFQLLRYFIAQRGATLTRDELLNAVWGYEATPSTRTVDVHVSWLRRKLEAHAHRPTHIITVHGLGYKFVG